jgi:hypothetical protein
MSNETGWDIMSGNAIEESKVRHELIISSHGMTKSEFDDLVLLFSLACAKNGWVKVFSGLQTNGNYECRFQEK